MMQQMQQAMQGDEGGSEEGGRQQNADRDPLGRPRATTGPDFGDSVKVPDEIDVQRARQILEAIRKRLGNALSPEIERNYLERLLEMRKPEKLPGIWAIRGLNLTRRSSFRR
jgi:hypothetical protein